MCLRRPEATAYPGTMVQTRAWRNGVLEAEGFDPALISDHLEEPGTIVWLDLVDPDEDDLKLLAEEFGLHPLTIEDATRPHQRPAVRRYAHHLFLVSYGLRLRPEEDEEDGGAVVLSEVDAFAGERFLITVRKSPLWPIDELLARWDSREEIARHGVGYLLYELLDAVVDGYFDVVDGLADRIESLEEAIFDRSGNAEVHEALFSVRKELVRFRKVVYPLREVMNNLLRRDILPFDDEMIPYFQDVYDHVLRVTESADAMRDLLTSALEANLSMVSNRLNEIMKRITSWGAIAAAGTMIAGIYGMNFRLLPREGTLTGFWFAIALIVVSSAGLYAYFRRKGWL